MNGKKIRVFLSFNTQYCIHTSTWLLTECHLLYINILVMLLYKFINCLLNVCAHLLQPDEDLPGLIQLVFYCKANIFPAPHESAWRFSFFFSNIMCNQTAVHFLSHRAQLYYQNPPNIQKMSTEKEKHFMYRFILHIMLYVITVTVLKGLTKKSLKCLW